MNDSGPTQLGALIRRFRLTAGLSQEQLAERSGLSARAISDLERGLRKTPHPDTLRMLAEGLAMSSEDRETLLLTARPDLKSPARSATLSASAVQGLPVPHSALIGREQVLADLVAQLRGSESRLITLTGPGGVGKTRLALEAARLTAPDFADGAVFVDLAPIIDPGLVPPAIAQALGVLEAGARPLREALGIALRHRRLLLLLDNFEQVIDAASEVASFVTGAPELQVMVTSREALRVRGEHEVVVPPLDLPSDPDVIDLERLQENPSVSLFVQVASTVNPEFALTLANATAVAEICRRLDGLPLAIELAASRVKYFPPSTLLEHLDHRFSVLTGGPRDLPARQQTLRDTVAWSYALLSPGEQALFRRLGIFAAGGTIPAIEAVALTPGDLQINLLGGLASLVDKSLIRQAVDHEGLPRFSMLETLREFALDELRQAGEAEIVEHALAEWVVRFVAGRIGDNPLPGTLNPADLPITDRELDNIRQAISYLSAREDAESYATLFTSLFGYFYIRGRFREALSIGRQTLELAEQHAIPDHLRGMTLSALAVLETVMGQATVGEAYAREALVALKRSDERDGQLPDALLALAIVLREQGRYSEAREYAEEAHTVAAASGDLPRSSFALYHIGRLAFLQGDLDRAVACLSDSVQQGSAMGSIETAWSSLIYLAAVHVRRGNLLEAAEALRAADRLWREIGGRIVSLFLNVVGAFVARIQPVDAVRIYGAVADHRYAIGAEVVDEPWIASVKLDLREQLGDETFDAAYQAGRRLSVDDAIAVMRDVLDEFERSAAH